MKKKIVIIGGGFAGLSCARKLANNKNFNISLIDKQNHHLFQPLLYQIASATLSAPDIARSLRGILCKAKNVSVFLDNIQSINLREKTVSGQNAVYSYDYLVIAAGTKTSWFGNDEWQKYTIGLKTLADSYRIHKSILSSLEKAELSHNATEQAKLMTVVIVGGGPTGVELAGAFEDLVQQALHSDFRRIDPTNLRTILIQSGDRILKNFSKEHSEYARHKLKTLGVEIILNDRVVDVGEEVVTLRSGKTIEASTIIWAAGQQADAVTKPLDVNKDRSGRLIVEEDLSLANYPNVLVAGDIANVSDKNGVNVPALAPAAVQMGEHAAKVIKEDHRLANSRFKSQKHHLRPRFAYWDKGIMAIIRRNSAVVDSKQLKLTGFSAWLAWLLIHILFLIGFRNKISVLVQWASAYISKKPGGRVYSTEEQLK